MKKYELDSINTGYSKKRKQESLDRNKEGKRKRSKWLRGFLNIIDSIVTALT
jgi:hypothetical protein